MIIYFNLLLIWLNVVWIESVSIGSRNFKNDLVPLLSSRLDSLRKDPNSLKIVSNEPFIIQLKVPTENDVKNDGKEKKTREKKRKRPTKKRLPKLKPLRKKHRIRRDVKTGKKIETTPRSLELVSKQPKKQHSVVKKVEGSQNQTSSKYNQRNFIGQKEILKALSQLRKLETKTNNSLEAKKKEERKRSLEKLKIQTDKKNAISHRHHTSPSDQAIIAKMTYPPTPKMDQNSHEYTHQDLVADRERLEEKIKYLKNMLSLNDSKTADDGSRVRRRTESDRVANKIAKMFLTLSAVNGLHDKRKSKCTEEEDEDDDGDVWEEERRNSLTRKNYSSNEERYKVKKWIEHMKNKRSSRTCPCMANANGDENDVFPLELKFAKAPSLSDRSSEESLEAPRERNSFYYSSSKPGKYNSYKGRQSYEDPDNKLMIFTKRGRRKLELPIEDLELYRSRAKQILRNAEEILDKIKEEEEKRLANPNIVLSQLRELTSRIQADPRNNENDLIRIIQKNLGLGSNPKAQDENKENSFINNLKAFILDPYEKAKALTDESTRQLSSYLLRNLGKLENHSEKSGELKKPNEENHEEMTHINHSQEPHYKLDTLSSANLEKGIDNESDSKKQTGIESTDTLSSTSNVEKTEGAKKDVKKTMEDPVRKRMEEMLKEQKEKLKYYEENPEMSKNLKEVDEDSSNDFDTTKKTGVAALRKHLEDRKNKKNNSKEDTVVSKHLNGSKKDELESNDQEKRKHKSFERIPGLKTGKEALKTLKETGSKTEKDSATEIADSEERQKLKSSEILQGQREENGMSELVQKIDNPIDGKEGSDDGIEISGKEDVLERGGEKEIVEKNLPSTKELKEKLKELAKKKNSDVGIKDTNLQSEEKGVGSSKGTTNINDQTHGSQEKKLKTSSANNRNESDVLASKHFEGKDNTEKENKGLFKNKERKLSTNEKKENENDNKNISIESENNSRVKATQDKVKESGSAETRKGIEKVPKLKTSVKTAERKAETQDEVTGESQKEEGPNNDQVQASRTQADDVEQLKPKLKTLEHPIENIDLEGKNKEKVSEADTQRLDGEGETTKTKDETLLQMAKSSDDLEDENVGEEEDDDYDVVESETPLRKANSFEKFDRKNVETLKNVKEENSTDQKEKDTDDLIKGKGSEASSRAENLPKELNEPIQGETLKSGDADTTLLESTAEKKNDKQDDNVKEEDETLESPGEEMDDKSGEDEALRSEAKVIDLDDTANGEGETQLRSESKKTEDGKIDDTKDEENDTPLRSTAKEIADKTIDDVIEGEDETPLRSSEKGIEDKNLDDDMEEESEAPLRSAAKALDELDNTEMDRVSDNKNKDDNDDDTPLRSKLADLKEELEGMGEKDDTPLRSEAEKIDKIKDMKGEDETLLQSAGEETEDKEDGNINEEDETSLRSAKVINRGDTIDEEYKTPLQSAVEEMDKAGEYVNRQDETSLRSPAKEIEDKNIDDTMGEEDKTPLRLEDKNIDDTLERDDGPLRSAVKGMEENVDDTMEGEDEEPLRSAVERMEDKDIDDTLQGEEEEPLRSTIDGMEDKNIDDTLEGEDEEPLRSSGKEMEGKSIDDAMEREEETPLRSVIKGMEDKDIDDTLEGENEEPLRTKAKGKDLGDTMDGDETPLLSELEEMNEEVGDSMKGEDEVPLKSAAEGIEDKNIDDTTREEDETPLRSEAKKIEDMNIDNIMDGDETPLISTAEEADNENKNREDETSLRLAPKQTSGEVDTNIDEEDETPLRSVAEEMDKLDDMNGEDEEPLRSQAEAGKEMDYNLNGEDETPLRSADKKINFDEATDREEETPLRSADRVIDLDEATDREDETPLQSADRIVDEVRDEQDETPLKSAERIINLDEATDREDETPLRSADRVIDLDEATDREDETPLQSADRILDEATDEQDETPLRSAERIIDLDEATDREDETPLQSADRILDEATDVQDETPLRSADRVIDLDEATDGQDETPFRSSDTVTDLDEATDREDETPLRSADRAMDLDEATDRDDEIPLRSKAIETEDKNIDETVNEDETPLRSVAEEMDKVDDINEEEKAILQSEAEEVDKDVDYNPNEEDDTLRSAAEAVNQREDGGVNDGEALSKNEQDESLRSVFTGEDVNDQILENKKTIKDATDETSLKEIDNKDPSNINDETPLRSANPYAEFNEPSEDDLEDESVSDGNDDESSFRAAYPQEHLTNSENSREMSYETEDEYNYMLGKKNYPEPDPVVEESLQKLDPTPKIHKGKKLKIPYSIEKMMEDLEGKRDADLSMQNLDSEKIDHFIDRIDEAEQKSMKEGEEINCFKECACADEINVRSKKIGRYEIAKDILHWMKDLQLNRVLSDD